MLTYSLFDGCSWRETPVLYFEVNPDYNRTRKGIKIVWDLQPCRTEGSGKPQGNKTRPHYNHIFMYIRSSKCERCTLVAFPVFEFTRFSVKARALQRSNI